MARTIAVDFDGVIHDYAQGWGDGTIYGDPTPGAHTALTHLMDRYAVFVHTTRVAVHAAEWITDRLAIPTTTVNPDGQFWNRQGVLLVTSRKYPALAYIDDRAVPYTGDWTTVLNHPLIGVTP